MKKNIKVAKYAYWIQKLTEDEYTDSFLDANIEVSKSFCFSSVENTHNSLKELSTISSKRKSSRQFSGERTSFETCHDILRLSYGAFDENHRTVPSAGDFYPLTLWLFEVCNGKIKKRYTYDSKLDGIVFQGFSDESLADGFSVYHVDFSEVSWVILWTCRLIKPALKYGARGYRFSLIEVGHSAQMTVLSCCALNIQHITLGGLIEKHIRDKWLNTGRRYLPQYALAFR